MPLSKGERLGSYVVLGPIGAGGMGEVYRAHDARLNREVAIKILPAAFATDHDRLTRFQRESKALAALSHSNILAIFDVGTSGEISFLVTELLLGQTLRARMQVGLLPRQSVIAYGAQIAKGLAAAHGKGIVHRDLKPENIFLTADNQVKILDFGLAKLAQSEEGDEETISWTNSAQTQGGGILGTPNYMSPELARRTAVDARSDIFSFGAILYEMLFGRMAFKRPSTVETMNAVLNEEPLGLSESNSDLPQGLQMILRRCLEKAPDRRFQCASDLAFAMETQAALSSPALTQKVPAAVQRDWRFYAVSALAAVVLSGVLISSRLKSSPPPAFQQLIFGRGFISSARFTPDGESVVYGAAFGGRAREMFLTRLDGRSSRHMGLPAADILGISKHGNMAISIGRHNYHNWMVVGTLGLASLSGGPARAILADVCDGDIAADGNSLAIVRCGGNVETLEFPIGKALFHTNGWIGSSPDITERRRRCFP